MKSKIEIGTRVKILSGSSWAGLTGTVVEVRTSARGQMQVLVSGSMPPRDPKAEGAKPCKVSEWVATFGDERTEIRKGRAVKVRPSNLEVLPPSRKKDRPEKED